VPLLFLRRPTVVPVEHTFTLSRADFAAFRKQAGLQLRKRRPGAPWLFLLYVTCWLIAGAAVSSFVRVYERGGSLRSSLLVAAGLVVSATVLVFLFQVVKSNVLEKYLLLDSGGFLSPQTLEYQDDGIRLTTKKTGSSAWLPWGAFMGRAEDARNLYLFTEPSYGVIVPKAELPDACSAMLRSRIREL
jgi:hypothetical protein